MGVGDFLGNNHSVTGAGLDGGQGRRPSVPAKPCTSRRKNAINTAMACNFPNRTAGHRPGDGVNSIGKAGGC